MSKGKMIALWIVSGLLAAMFLFSGCMKLLHLDAVKPMFVKYGYAPWFATFIGTCETLGGIGVLIPQLAGLAASGLTIIMAGAVYTHLSHQENSHALVPLVLMLMCAWVAFVRFRKTPAQL